MGFSKVASIHNDLRDGSGEIQQSAGTATEADKGWTFGPGLNIKIKCKTCCKIGMIPKGTGLFNFGELDLTCPYPNCGSASLALHGLHLGGKSNSTSSSKLALTYKIEGAVYTGKDEDDEASEAFDSGDVSKQLLHSELFAFKETKEVYKYKRLKVNTW